MASGGDHGMKPGNFGSPVRAWDFTVTDTNDAPLALGELQYKIPQCELVLDSVQGYYTVTVTAPGHCCGIICIVEHAPHNSLQLQNYIVCKNVGAAAACMSAETLARCSSPPSQKPRCSCRSDSSRHNTTCRGTKEGTTLVRHMACSRRTASMCRTGPWVIPSMAGRFPRTSFLYACESAPFVWVFAAVNVMQWMHLDLVQLWPHVQ
jgi:hypothetical protein